MLKTCLHDMLDMRLLLASVVLLFSPYLPSAFVNRLLMKYKFLKARDKKAPYSPQ